MKELKIDIPEGYEIDNENSTFECIKFKKKKNLPTSWKEYLSSLNPYSRSIVCEDINKLTDTILPIRHIALYKLELLRNCWREGWRPDWESGNEKKYCIYISNKAEINYCLKYKYPEFLSFDNIEKTEKFIECFHDLIIQAEDLI